MTENDLNIELEKLQSESVNNGGTWRFLKLPLSPIENILDYLKNIDKKVKINTIFFSNTKKIITESIEHWSLYSRACPDRTENSINFDKLKVTFIYNLFHFIEEKRLWRYIVLKT